MGVSLAIQDGSVSKVIGVLAAMINAEKDSSPVLFRVKYFLLE